MEEHRKSVTSQHHHNYFTGSEINLSKNCLEATRQIFDIGGIRNNLTPCYIEWLNKVLRKGYWKLTAIPFVEIIEQRKPTNFGFVYDCGYCEFSGIDGFKESPMAGRGYHYNLHQAIHCLNKYREMGFDNIEIEHRYNRYNHWDILAKNSEKTIIGQLGSLSNYNNFFSIYEYDEFWFNSNGINKKFFYSLRANSEIPQDEKLTNFMREFFEDKGCCETGRSVDCWNYCNNIHYICCSLRKNK
jgi:hypothetical protein